MRCLPLLCITILIVVGSGNGERIIMGSREKEDVDPRLQTPESRTVLTTEAARPWRLAADC